MPRLIIHEMGKKPRFANMEQDSITLGRDDGCDVSLSNVSVSRKHAVIKLSEQASYYIEPISQENPILINSQQIESATHLREGDEIQLGCYLLIFSQEKKARQGYLDAKTHRYDAKCNVCGWTGLVSVLIKDPKCVRCGESSFSRMDDIKTLSAPGQTLSAPTAHLTAEDVQRFNLRLLEAKKARIERVNTVVGLKNRHDLTEERPCTFGKKSNSDMPLEGMLFGTPVHIKWLGTRYVIVQKGFFKLKLNGKVVQEAPLRNGDEFLIGKNHFRFVVG